MKVAESHIKSLAEIIAGDVGYTLYLSGSRLVELFNVCCGFKDVYGQGFPTRRDYVANKLYEINDTPNLEKVLEAVVDPFLYLNSGKDISDAVCKINDFLSFDGIELRLYGKKYKAYLLDEDNIKPETLIKLNNDYLIEQINKCDEKIKNGYFEGAITNARTMVEAIICYILSKTNGKYKSNGAITKDYKEIQKILKLNPYEYPAYIEKILSGLINILEGLAGTRNNMSDSHPRRLKPEKHHAKLAVNASKTLSEFLIESFKKQYDL